MKGVRPLFLLHPCVSQQHVILSILFFWWCESAIDWKVWERGEEMQAKAYTQESNPVRCDQDRGRPNNPSFFNNDPPITMREQSSPLPRDITVFCVFRVRFKRGYLLALRHVPGGRDGSVVEVFELVHPHLCSPPRVPTLGQGGGGEAR